VAGSLAAAVNIAFFFTSRMNWSFPHGREHRIELKALVRNGLVGEHCSLQIEIAIPVHEKGLS
jgi:hypothetical protein